jgi:subtilisin family serine protease
VTATATLIRSRWPTLDAPNVVNRLIRTARDLGPDGRDDRYGYGEVDPVTALTAEVAPVRGNPLSARLADDPQDAASGTDVGPQPPPARVAALTGPHRLVISLSAGALVFLLLLGAGLYLVRRSPALADGRPG